MDHIEEKLNSFLNDPNAMKAVMELAQQLSGEAAQKTVPQSDQNPSPDFDPALLSRLMPLLSEFRRKDSDAAKLLWALQPYLSEKRQDKVERAVKLAHMITVSRKFLTEGGWELV